MPSATILSRVCAVVTVLLLLLVDGPRVAAQRPQICGPGAKMTLKCVDACIICDIDGFTGSNDNGGREDEGDMPKDFCTAVNHNIQWIGFVAGSRELTLDLTVSNCAKTSPDPTQNFSFGLEAGVYEVLDCDYKRAVSRSNCNSNINDGQTAALVMDDLVPGNYYYLVIDGNYADVCNYSVKVTRGTTEIPKVANSGGLRGPTRMCNGPQARRYQIDAVPAATYYDWTLDGVPIGTEDDLHQDLTFPQDGTYELCVTASSLCNAAPPECLTIEVGDYAPQRFQRSSCAGVPVVVEGTTVTESGTYTYTLTSKAGCDSTVIYDVTIGDPITVAVDTTICAGSQAVINGQTITTGGDYPFATKTRAGCDSVITYRVTVTEVPRGRVDTVLCTGRPAIIRGRVIRDAGTYDFPLVTQGGCDSIVTYHVTLSEVLRGSETLILCAGRPATLHGRVISEAGTYEFPLATAGGCDSIVTYTVTVADTLRGREDLTLCAGQSTTLHGRVISTPGTYRFPLATAGGCDSIVVYSVTVADTLRGSEDLTICSGNAVTLHGQVIGAAGSYRFVLKSSGGCDSVTTYRVTVTPPPRGAVDTVLCPGASATIHGRLITAAGTYAFPLATAGGCDSVVTYRVTVREPVVVRSDTSVCVGEVVRFDGRDLREAGVYRATRGGASGCDSVMELALKHKSCGFEATAEATPVSCAGGSDGTVTAYVVGLAPPYALTYTHEGAPNRQRPIAVAADSTPTHVRDLPAGTYVLTITDRLGGAKSLTVAVGTPRALRANTKRIADGAFDLRCAGAADGRALALASGGTPPYAFRWSDGSTTPERSGLAAQSLTVTVTDGQGCVDSTRVTLTAPPRLALEVQVIDQGCDPVREPGAVRVVNLAGGRAGYRLQIDGLSATSKTDRYPLAPGPHTVTLRDAAECRTDTSFTVTALTVPEARVDSTWRITKGDEVTLGVRTAGEIVAYEWSGPTTLSCEDCPAPVVSPRTDATYEVVVTNDDGCQARAEALVYVVVDRNLWAPTAFSPDGNGVNDGFTVYVADEGSVIEELQVFDRWGEQLFVAEEIAPGDTSAGWDGTYRGQALNAGVYVYWARVRNSDGVTDLVKGDFTLMR